MSKQKKFVVAEGTHYDEKSKAFSKGEAVVSELPLDKIFPNKFSEDAHFRPEEVAGKQKELSDRAMAKEASALEGKAPKDKEESKPKEAPARKFLSSSTKDTDEDEDDEDDEGTQDPKRSPIGKDKTADYDVAKKAGLKVFLRDGAYTVVDSEAPNVALNDTPLKAAFVEDFIKKYLKTR